MSVRRCFISWADPKIQFAISITPASIFDSVAACCCKKKKRLASKRAIDNAHLRVCFHTCLTSNHIGVDFFLKKANSRGARIFIRTLFSLYRVSQKK